MARNSNSTSAAKADEANLYKPSKIPTLTDLEVQRLLDLSRAVTQGRIDAGNPRKALGSHDITIRCLYTQQKRGMPVRTQIADANSRAKEIAAQIRG
jgi:hypothetical protein